MKIKAGTTLVIETGEYSDYAFTGPFKVLKDFDQATVADKYRAQWTPRKDRRYSETPVPDSERFVPWLSREGYIEDVPNVVSWHIDHYGDFHPEIQEDEKAA